VPMNSKPGSPEPPDNIARHVIAVFWVIVVLGVLSFSCQISLPLVPFAR
jgi:hypothetical protein